MKTAMLVVVVAAALAAVAQAAQVPLLPDACITDRTDGCCPGLIDLLDAEANGCTVDSIVEAASAADAATACTSCGEKFSSIASVYSGRTGTACALVQQHVFLFPFACTSNGDVANCLHSVQQLTADSSTTAATVATNGFCGSYGCWGNYLRHMRTSQYNLAGVETTDAVARIGGVSKLLTCAVVDGEACAATAVPNYWSSITAFADGVSTLEEFTLDPSADYCTGCNRVAFSNALVNVVNEAHLQYAAESLRRLALGGCEGGCSASYRSMVPGQRAFLDLQWASCADLYAGTPSCSSACNDFGLLLESTFGCCARFALESASIEIARRGNSAIPGSGASVSTFISNFNQHCAANLMTDCTKDWAVTGNPAIQPSDTYTESVETTGSALSEEDLAVALAARIGALAEDLTLGDVRDSNKYDVSMVGRTVASTAQAGEAMSSILRSGGAVVETGATSANRVMLDPTAPPSADLIPNYGFVPGLGFVTTDCDTLKQVQQAVDCTIPDSTDAYGNELWVVAGLNARSSSA